MKHERHPTTPRGGNVFADIGLSNAEERLAKAKLAGTIADIISEREWTQSQAAERVQLTQANISQIVRGRLADFSIERLQTTLRFLSVDVEISLHRRSDGGFGHLHVMERA